MNRIKKLHHITAIASDAQANIDFYEGVLGQRLVKTTVNFDDPSAHHLYYGDEMGTPGTIMTFFPWRHAGRGRAGTGETGGVTYAAPAESLGYWAERLEAAGVSIRGVEERFGEQVLLFEDPDGLSLGIVGINDEGRVRHWREGPVAEEHSLRGLHSVSLWLSTTEPTAALLQAGLGYTFEGKEAHRHRFRAGSDGPARYIDIEHRPDSVGGVFGAGSIHHIAFRGADDKELIEYQERLTEMGSDVSPIRDRQYFHSIYFREPGGVLFEVATDAPGFASDEPVETLGDALKLPPWLEARRSQIEERLPPFERPTLTTLGSTTG